VQGIKINKLGLRDRLGWFMGYWSGLWVTGAGYEVPGTNGLAMGRLIDQTAWIQS
jgi:hypothetical protein